MKHRQQNKEGAGTSPISLGSHGAQHPCTWTCGRCTAAHVLRPDSNLRICGKRGQLCWGWRWRERENFKFLQMTNDHGKMYLFEVFPGDYFHPWGGSRDKGLCVGHREAGTPSPLKHVLTSEGPPLPGPFQPPGGGVGHVKHTLHEGLRARDQPPGTSEDGALVVPPEQLAGFPMLLATRNIGCLVEWLQK